MVDGDDDGGIDEVERELRARDHELLKRVGTELRKHFDTVDIFVTRADESSNRLYTAEVGWGNWFARIGYIGSWIKWAFSADDFGGSSYDEEGEDE